MIGVRHTNRGALLDAAKSGSFTQIQEALQAVGANPDYCDERTGNTALHYAIANPHIKQNQYVIIRKILEANPDVNRSRFVDGKTPLHLAVENNDIDIVRLLLAARAEVDKAANDNHTPLAIAIANNNIHIIILLIEHGAFINSEEIYEALARLCRNNENEKTSIQALKTKLFSLINQPNQPHTIINKISLLSDALNKFKPLGEIMFTKCGRTACDIERGTLLKIHTALITAREYKEAIDHFHQAAPTIADLIMAIDTRNQGKVEFILSTLQDPVPVDAFIKAATSGHTGIMKEFIKVFLTGKNLINLYEFIKDAQQACRGCSPSQRKKASHLQDSIKLIKDEIIHSIETSEDEEKERKVAEACDRTSTLGRIIYIQRSYTACKEGHGSLKLIQKILDDFRERSPLRALALHAQPRDGGAAHAGRDDDLLDFERMRV